MGHQHQEKWKNADRFTSASTTHTQHVDLICTSKLVPQQMSKFFWLIYHRPITDIQNNSSTNDKYIAQNTTWFKNQINQKCAVVSTHTSTPALIHPNPNNTFDFDLLTSGLVHAKDYISSDFVADSWSLYPGRARKNIQTSRPNATKCRQL